MRTLYDPEAPPEEYRVLDSNALILYFPGPNSATGEDVLELHIHGGPAVIKAIIAAIPRTVPKGHRNLLRYAEPGEFTRKAFYNDRLDLTRIEALGDLLSAETEQQRRLALRGTTNTLCEKYESWERMLIHARAEIETLIDFSEDQHLEESPKTLLKSTTKKIKQLRLEILATLENASRGELLRAGINVAFLGAPNVGKSSLLNTIVGREAAIVSREEGTTRDVVDVGIDIGGFYSKFEDLAGLRESLKLQGSASVGEIEQEGMRRAKERILGADVVIVVLSADSLSNMNSEVKETIKSCIKEPQRVLYVINKSDLLENRRLTTLEALRRQLTEYLHLENLPSDNIPKLFISCKQAQASDTSSQDPDGIQNLLHTLTQLFKEMTLALHPPVHDSSTDASVWELSLGATERQRNLLQQCLENLDAFLAQSKSQRQHLHPDSPHGEEEGQLPPTDPTEVDIVVTAETLRSAAACLAKITGKGETGNIEDVLGVVFAKFVPPFPSLPFPSTHRWTNPT